MRSRNHLIRALGAEFYAFHSTHVRLATIAFGTRQFEVDAQEMELNRLLGEEAIASKAADKVLLRHAC